MKRIFVAIDISMEARSKVSAYIETLRNGFPRVRVSWEKAEKLHLTLKFLGETNENQLVELIKIVKEIAAKISNFRLQISDTGVFSNVRNPKTLWIDVRDKQGNLTKISQLLENECEKIGFPKERRKYIPHLTIGRVREPHKSKNLAIEHLQNKIEPIEFEVSEIVIYESKLLPTGSIYTFVSKHKLI